MRRFLALLVLIPGVLLTTWVRSEPPVKSRTVALRFIPVSDLEAEGYGEFRSLFETTTTTTKEHAS